MPCRINTQSAHNFSALNRQHMESRSYGSTVPPRDSGKAAHHSEKNRLDYLFGVTLSLILVFLSVFANFVTQVRFGFPSPDIAQLTTSLYYCV